MLLLHWVCKIDKELQAPAVESVTVQHCKPPHWPEPPPPLGDYEDIAVSYNGIHSTREKKLTMGLATANRGRARTAIIAFKENIFCFKGSE